MGEGINGVNTRTLLVNRDNELAAMLQIGGRYALLQNDPDLVVMAAGQGIRVIYRESGDAPEDEPLRQDPAAFVQKRAEHAPAAYYIHCLNEIDPSAEEQRWNREAFKYAKSIGRRLLVGNYSTHRSREQWAFARPLLAEAVGAGHAIGFHHYVPPGNAAGGLEWLATKLSVGGLWLCSEFAFGRYTADGQIDPHRGWRGITSPQERRDFIEKWSMYYSAKNIALMWYCYDFWDKPNLEVAKAEGFGYNDLPDVLDSFATFNQLYMVKDMPTTLEPIPAPTEGGEQATLTAIPADFINVRNQPNGGDVGDLLVGDVVTVYPDAPVVAGGTQWVYLTPLTPIARPVGRQNAAAGWTSLQDGKVTFTPYTEPPPPPVEPPAEETVEFKLAEVETLIAEQEALVVGLRAAIINAENTIALLRGKKLPTTPFTLSYPVVNPVIVQRFGVNTTGDPTFYSQYGLPAHEGVDFKAQVATPVLACADGVISRIERREFVGIGSPYGVQIRITHQWGDQEYETIYAHMEWVGSTLSVGDSVKRGQPVGVSGNTGNSTGAHLHLSFKKRGATAAGEKQKLGDGSWVVYPSDLIDPTPFFAPALVLAA